MSVTSAQTRRRWAAVAAGVAALIAVPAGISALAGRGVASRGAGTTGDPRDLMAKVLASQEVAYSGLATSRGNLGLPDLPATGDATAALGGTTRTRTWWAGPERWRVSVITPTGEQGVYQRGNRTYLWNYEDNDLTRMFGTPSLRLPRPDDLVPPQAARRLLAGVGPQDRVEAIPGRRIAGVTASGIRVRPGDRRSTIGAIDVWARPADGLPLAISITSAAGVPALDSRFVQLGGPPSPSDVSVPAAPGADRAFTPAADLAARVSRLTRIRMPDQLAGFRSTAPVAGAAATYGTGLVRFVALPVPGSDAGDLSSAVRSAASQERRLRGGQALLLTAGALNLVVAEAYSSRTYVLTGPVEPETLFAAAEQLFVSP